MSKREFYDSIINFRTNLETKLDEDEEEDRKTRDEVKALMQPPPVEVPRQSHISTLSQHQQLSGA
jgi:hypothetical protein